MNEHSLHFADRKLKAAKGAFDASIDNGITFFDTAEVYGAGVRINIVLAVLIFCNKGSCFIDHCQDHFRATLITF
jgi:hypothetical protein